MLHQGVFYTPTKLSRRELDLLDMRGPGSKDRPGSVMGALCLLRIERQGMGRKTACLTSEGLFCKVDEPARTASQARTAPSAQYRASEKEWFGSDVAEAMEEEGADQDAPQEEEAEPDRATSQTASPSPRAQVRDYILLMAMRLFSVTFVIDLSDFCVLQGIGLMYCSYFVSKRFPCFGLPCDGNF